MSKVFRVAGLLAVFLLSSPSFAQVQTRCGTRWRCRKVDTKFVFAALNTPASGPNDPRDADGEGTITILDVRRCVLLCTLPGCAEPPTNSAPTADAGSDQTVAVGETVTLDGSGSTDPDGDSLFYDWVIVSQPAGGTAAIADPRFSRHSTEVAGDYVIELTVNDGTATGARRGYCHGAGNTAPVGCRPTTALLGTLDGSGSRRDGLAFWTLANAPAGAPLICLTTRP